MEKIICIDRKTNAPFQERIYGEKFLKLLYGSGWSSTFFGWFWRPVFAKIPFFSKLYGFLQRCPSSRARIAPFIKKYEIDESEFLTREFRSFNDFFIRKLRPESRQICSESDRAILPADGRFLVYPDFSKINRLEVKGMAFSLAAFLKDRVLARRYADGGMLIARLCPADYHRFHFPCDGIASKSEAIEGSLYSVNPIALQRRPFILAENRRMITEIESSQFGTIYYVEVGATFVGSIHQTYLPGAMVKKGEEKGYFSFGGSCLVLLFEKKTIQFDADLVENSLRGIETYARMGESLGKVYGR